MSDRETRVRSLSGNGYSRQKRYLEIRRLVSVSWTFCGACAHRARWRWQRQRPTSPPWLRFNDPILLEASESLKSWKCKSIKINKPVYSAGSERFISVGEFKLSDTVKTFSVARYRNSDASCYIVALKNRRAWMFILKASYVYF